MRNLTIESVYPESKNKRRLLFTGVGKRGLSRPGKWVGVPFGATKIAANGRVSPVTFKTSMLIRTTRTIHTFVEIVTIPGGYI